MYKLNQAGDGAIALFLLLATVGIVWFFYISTQQQNLWNAWNRDCTAHHGTVGQVYEHAFSEGYECFVDGKIVTLPGFEQYSTGVKN